jgi:2-dehydro-3-deoxy-D-gluconate 5-dehydrogenase
MSLLDFSMDFFSLKGKVAIVTGGNTGLGQGYAVALAKAGADLFIVAHGDNWQETKDLIETTGQKAVFYQAELTNKESLKGVVKGCLDAYGKIDILVNNAGTIRRAPLLEYKDEDWNAVMDINLNSLYFLSQLVAKEMVEQGSGKIINIASMLTFQGGKFVPAYTASKHGVAGLTKAFANELASKNIQINAIAQVILKRPILPRFVQMSQGTKTFSQGSRLKNGEHPLMSWELSFFLPARPLII